MTDDPAWDDWFSFQYDLREDVTALIQQRTKGRSEAFKTAVYSALIETLAENMRLFITLSPPPSGTPVEPELIDGWDAPADVEGHDDIA